MLSDYDDKDKLHDLFQEKGFEKFTQQELEERRLEEKEVENVASDAKNRLDGRAAGEREGGLWGGERGVANFLTSVNDVEKSSINANKKLSRARLKEKLHKLKEARENYMMLAPHVEQ